MERVSPFMTGALKVHIGYTLLRKRAVHQADLYPKTNKSYQPVEQRLANLVATIYHHLVLPYSPKHTVAAGVPFVHPADTWKHGNPSLSTVSVGHVASQSMTNTTQRLVPNPSKMPMQATKKNMSPTTPPSSKRPCTSYVIPLTTSSLASITSKRSIRNDTIQNGQIDTVTMPMDFVNGAPTKIDCFALKNNA